MAEANMLGGPWKLGLSRCALFVSLLAWCLPVTCHGKVDNVGSKMVIEPLDLELVRPRKQSGDKQNEAPPKPQGAAEGGALGVIRREAEKAGSGNGVMRVQIAAGGESEALPSYAETRGLAEPSHTETFGLAKVDAADGSGCHEQEFHCRDFAEVNIGHAGRKLTIVRATYGGHNPDRDVTEKVRDLADHQGRVHVTGGIHTRIGDPEPGVPKTFRVWYKSCEETTTSTTTTSTTTTTTTTTTSTTTTKKKSKKSNAFVGKPGSTLVWTTLLAYFAKLD